MKRVVLLLLAAALAASATAAARPAAKVKTRTPGVLTIAFGDSAVGFASYQLRGNNVINPRGYEADIARFSCRACGISAIRRRANLPMA